MLSGGSGMAVWGSRAASLHRRQSSDFLLCPTSPQQRRGQARRRLKSGAICLTAGSNAVGQVAGKVAFLICLHRYGRTSNPWNDIGRGNTSNRGLHATYGTSRLDPACRSRAIEAMLKLAQTRAWRRARGEALSLASEVPGKGGVTSDKGGLAHASVQATGANITGHGDATQSRGAERERGRH